MDSNCERTPCAAGKDVILYKDCGSDTCYNYSQKSKEATALDEKQIAEAVAAYVEDNLHEDLCLESIADKLGYSKFHINRVFAVVTGCTIYKYIQMRRLTEAARQLVETEKPIVEIAYEAHYNSQQAFTLAFHREYQCAPGIYRRNGVFYPKKTRAVIENRLYRAESSFMGSNWKERAAA